MLAKIPSYQIADFFKSQRLNTKDLAVYYRQSGRFAYQIIFSAKTKLKVVEKNKSKRQIRQELLSQNFQELDLELLFLVKNKTQDFQALKSQVKQIKTKLLAINH